MPSDPPKSSPHLFSRRDLARSLGVAVPAAMLGKAALAQTPFTLTPPLRQNSMANLAGVRMGSQTYSFHDVPRQGTPEVQKLIIDYLDEAGLNDCEIMSAHIEAPGRSE